MDGSLSTKAFQQANPLISSQCVIGIENISREIAVVQIAKKSHYQDQSARTKTDTGREVENTKTRGRTFVKELGKMSP